MQVLFGLVDEQDPRFRIRLALSTGIRREPYGGRDPPSYPRTQVRQGYGNAGIFLRIVVPCDANRPAPVRLDRTGFVGMMLERDAASARRCVPLRHGPNLQADLALAA